MQIKWWSSPAGKALIAILLAEVVSSFELGLVYSAMGALYREFNDPVTVGWILTSFLLVAAGTVAICGRLGDIYGRKRVMAWILGISAFGSLVSALSPTSDGVIIGRAIQGLSGAILPLCLGLVRENLPQDQATMGFGAVIATANISGAVSIVLGGLIVDLFGWQAVFFLSAATAALALAVVLAWLPVSRRAPASGAIDWLGGMLFVPAVAGLLFAITKGKVWGWIDVRTVALAGASGLTLCVWSWHELRQNNPLINVRLLANRQVLLTNACMVMVGIGALQYGALVSMFLQQPVWTTSGFGLSATAAALVTVPAVLIGGIGGPWSARVAARQGTRVAMIVGALLLAFGWSSIALFHHSFWVIAAMMIPSMIGLAFVLASAPGLLMEVVPMERTSEANGLAGVFRQVFTAVGAQIVAFALALSTVTGGTAGGKLYPSMASYQVAFGVMAVASILCALCAFCLPVCSKRKLVAQAAT